MKLKQQLVINGFEVITTTIDHHGMKLEQQLLINMEWSSNKHYWATWIEVRTTTTDQQGMKLGQQLLSNREWS